MCLFSMEFLLIFFCWIMSLITPPPLQEFKKSNIHCSFFKRNWFPKLRYMSVHTPKVYLNVTCCYILCTMGKDALAIEFCCMCYGVKVHASWVSVCVCNTVLELALWDSGFVSQFYVVCTTGLCGLNSDQSLN